jgi:hypothetical protein
VKQSSDAIRKSWKRRYFELEWPHLRYKKDAAEAEWKGVLLCDGVILTDDLQGVDRPHSFCALHKDRAPFFLQADTQEEMMDWVKAIRNDPSSECSKVEHSVLGAVSARTHARSLSLSLSLLSRARGRRGVPNRLRRA